MADSSSYVDLAERQLAWEESKGITAERDPESLTARYKASGAQSLDGYLRGCNAHLTQGAEPNLCVCYLDINSLYGAACEALLILFTQPLSPV